MPKSFKVKVKLAINEGKTLRKDENGMAELELPMEIPAEKQPLYTTNRITEEANDKRARVGDWLRSEGVEGITLMGGPLRSRLTPKDEAEKVIEERIYMNAKGTKSVPQVGKNLGMHNDKLRKRMQVYGIGRKIGKHVYVTKEEQILLKRQIDGINEEMAKLADTEEIAKALGADKAMVLHWIKRLSAKEEGTGRILPMKFPFIEVSGKYYMPRIFLEDKESLEHMKEDIPKQSMRINYEKEAKGRVNVGDFLEKYPELKPVTVRGYIRENKLGAKEGRIRYLDEEEQKRIVKYYGDRDEVEKDYHTMAEFSRLLEVPRSTAQNWVNTLSEEGTLLGAKTKTVDGTIYIGKKSVDTPEKIAELKQKIREKIREKSKPAKPKTEEVKPAKPKTEEVKPAKPKVESKILKPPASRSGEMEEHEEISGRKPMEFISQMRGQEKMRRLPAEPVLNAAERESRELRERALDRLEAEGLIEERNDILNIERRMEDQLPQNQAKHSIHNMYLQLANMENINFVSAVIFRERRKLD